MLGLFQRNQSDDEEDDGSFASDSEEENTEFVPGEMYPDDPRLNWESEISETMYRRIPSPPIQGARGAIHPGPNARQEDRLLRRGWDTGAPNLDYGNDRNLVSTGFFTEDYTGKVFETFREPDLMVPEIEQAESWESLSQDHPKLRFLTGNMDDVRGTEREEIEHHDIPSDANAYSDYTKVLQHEDSRREMSRRARREAYFTRDKERPEGVDGLSGHDVTRGLERPFGYYGFHPMYRPFVTPAPTQRGITEDRLQREGKQLQFNAPHLAPYAEQDRTTAVSNRLIRLDRDRALERKNAPGGRNAFEVDDPSAMGMKRARNTRGLNRREKYPVGKRNATMDGSEFLRDASSHQRQLQEETRIRDPIRRDPLSDDTRPKRMTVGGSSLFAANELREQRDTKLSMVDPARGRKKTKNLGIQVALGSDAANSDQLSRTSKSVKRGLREKGLNSRARLQAGKPYGTGQPSEFYSAEHPRDIEGYWMNDTGVSSSKSSSRRALIDDERNRHPVNRNQVDVSRIGDVRSGAATRRTDRLPTTRGFKTVKGTGGAAHNLSAYGTFDANHDAKTDRLPNTRGQATRSAAGFAHSLVEPGTARFVRDAYGSAREEREAFEPRMNMKEMQGKYTTVSVPAGIQSDDPRHGRMIGKITSRRAERVEDPANARSEFYFDLQGFNEGRDARRINPGLIRRDADARTGNNHVIANDVFSETSTAFNDYEAVRDIFETTRNTDYDTADYELGIAGAGLVGGTDGSLASRDIDHFQRHDFNVRPHDTYSERRSAMNPDVEDELTPWLNGSGVFSVRYDTDEREFEQGRRSALKQSVENFNFDNLSRSMDFCPGS